MMLPFISVTILQNYLIPCKLMTDILNPLKFLDYYFISSWLIIKQMCNMTHLSDKPRSSSTCFHLNKYFFSSPCYWNRFPAVVSRHQLSRGHVISDLAADSAQLSKPQQAPWPLLLCYYHCCMKNVEEDKFKQTLRRKKYEGSSENMNTNVHQDFLERRILWNFILSWDDKK